MPACQYRLLPLTTDTSIHTILFRHLLFDCLCSQKLTDNPFRALRFLCYTSWHLPASSSCSHTVLSSRSTVFTDQTPVCPAVLSACLLLWELRGELTLQPDPLLPHLPVGHLISRVTANQVAGQGSVCVCVSEHLNLWSVTSSFVWRAKFHFCSYLHCCTF